MKKFKITPVIEDIYEKTLAEKLGVCYSGLSQLVNKYQLGYTRAGASSNHFLTAREIELIKEYYAIKKEYKKKIKKWEEKVKSLK